jgi:predicted Holliday junction resolvase-like endonuclease
MLKSSKQSLATKYGRLTEQFMPFMKDYPYDAQQFRFIGTPIDGVQFEPDKIVFVEFKSADGRLSAKQKAIKDLVLNKKVEFKEVRVS